MASSICISPVPLLYDMVVVEIANNKATLKSGRNNDKVLLQKEFYGYFWNNNYRNIYYYFPLK